MTECPRQPSACQGCCPTTSRICAWGARDHKNPDTMVVSPFLGYNGSSPCLWGTNPWRLPSVHVLQLDCLSSVCPSPPPLQGKEVLANLSIRYTHSPTVIGSGVGTCSNPAKDTQLCLAGVLREKYHWFPWNLNREGWEAAGTGNWRAPCRNLAHSCIAWARWGRGRSIQLSICHQHLILSCFTFFSNLVGRRCILFSFYFAFSWLPMRLSTFAFSIWLSSSVNCLLKSFAPISIAFCFTFFPLFS